MGLTSHGTAKTKLAKLAFLFCREFVKNSINYSNFSKDNDELDDNSHSFVWLNMNKLLPGYFPSVHQPRSKQRVRKQEGQC